MQPVHSMDFCLLSKYDDLFTDIFLDALYLWFDTTKMNNDHRRPRIPCQKVLDIIQRDILGKGKLNDAVAELLAMDYFRHYLASKTAKQQQEFVQHMKRYLYMYMPNAGFEIGDTRRYSNNGRRVEACLIATKDWHVGDEMRLLTGMIACLDPKQDAELKKGNRDISVMWSSRKGCNCLFLGPARFVNHDCDSNCKFIASGQNTITFKVIKEIKCGEELTSFYGKHYFGENNCECRCVTCERRSTGYFASPDKPVAEEYITSKSGRRSTRKRKSAFYEDYVTSRSRPSKRSSVEIETKTAVDVCATVKTEKTETEENLPKISSPLADPTEQAPRPMVMRIGFLCGTESPEIHPQEMHEDVEVKSASSAGSDCPLDVLCNAVMDAEYMKVAPEMAKQEGITVIVSPEIHRDATTRIGRRSSDTHLVNGLREGTPNSSFSSVEFSSSTDDAKADSAVGLSPRFRECEVKEEDLPMNDHWKRDMDELFDEGVSDMDDLFDDVSDLSSVCSTELSTWSDSEPSSEAPSAPSSPKIRKAKKERGDSNKELCCIACGRTLRREEISEQVGSDVSLTNELATWTWSPSAIFTDWRPKRCPRCERHFTIFRQEWPHRKVKKPRKKKTKKDSQRSTSPKSGKLKSMTEPSSSSAKSSRKPESSKDRPLMPMKEEPLEELNFQPDDLQDSTYIPPLTPSSEYFNDGDDDDDDEYLA